MSETTIFSNATGLVTNFLKRNKSKAAVAPLLSNPVRFPHGGFQFKARVTPACAFQILASPDLQTWTPIESGTAGGESIEHLDTDAYKFSFRFYRAIAGGLLSPNVLGYAATTIPPGFAMIANPLNAPSNGLQALLPNMPEGTTLSKFDTKLYKLRENAFSNGQWQNPNDTLTPGEGAIIFNPTTDFRTLNFSGEVMQGNLLNPIPAGFSIRSSMVPAPGRLNVDLEFPLTDGDVIHLYDRDKQDYVIYEYPSKAWETSPPIIALGESFWVGKKSPGNWARNFVISGGMTEE